MDQDKSLYIKSILDNLDKETVELLDFDRLRDMLLEYDAEIRQSGALQSELLQMKEDYRRRLLGMLKALLACRHDASEADLAVVLADDTNLLPATDLIRLYNHTAARFRHRFPNSFKYVEPNEGGKGHWQEFKI